jgi:DNA-binding GntR family transcriptional regulator
VPLFWQLAATLFENLETGRWSEGARFATERELEEEFGVSQAVVRRALKILAGDGKIVSAQGSGTFVASSRREIPIFGVVEGLMDGREGLAFSVLTVRQRKPDSAIARFLDLEADSGPVAHITAVMQIDGRSVGLIETHVSIPLVPWLLPAVEAVQSGERPLRTGGLQLGRADVLVEHTYFEQWGGSTAGGSAGDPALMVRLIQHGRLEGGGDERPLEFARLVYRSDSTQVTLERAAPGA